MSRRVSPVSLEPKRGYYEAAPRPGMTRLVYVRKGWRLEPCPGSAHSNAFIDHCMLCAPLWGWRAVDTTGGAQ